MDNVFDFLYALFEFLFGYVHIFFVKWLKILRESRIYLCSFMFFCNMSAL